ncbi:MAG: Coenzyme F420 hydrogenase/dehydrogenase, beta subunit C-terminal domain, partial [Chloroflexi bacterium]|nr:Coenzyme F420 hydrogenase/dehydrogenase, beta subunit C-terminal domain [Chloroflexota bacterium]
QKGLAIGSELCTLCGLCVAVCPTSALALTASGTEPGVSLVGKCNDCGICYSICAGKDVPLRDLDRFVFGRERKAVREEQLIGIARACYQANAVDSGIRASGASGGAITALLVHALESKRVSAASVVAFDRQHPWKAKAVLATTRQEILDGANSKYVIVPINSVLGGPQVDKLPGQIGCVGLPCQVHSLRKLQYHYPKHRLSKKIAFIIGVHCGTNRRMADVESLFQENLGVKSLDEIRSLSFRKGKSPKVELEIVKTSGEIANAKKHGWQTRKTVAGRCMLCLDWGAELSDVSVGDFFGPAASNSDVHLGASTVVVRTEVGEQLVRAAVDAGYLRAYPTPVEPLMRSAGLAQKKLGCACAVTAFARHGRPCPDYQYEIEPMRPLDKAGVSSGMPIEEREQFWAQMGVKALS